MNTLETTGLKNPCYEHRHMKYFPCLFSSLPQSAHRGQALIVLHSHPTDIHVCLKTMDIHQVSAIFANECFRNRWIEKSMLATHTYQISSAALQLFVSKCSKRPGVDHAALLFRRYSRLSQNDGSTPSLSDFCQRIRSKPLNWRIHVSDTHRSDIFRLSSVLSL